MVFDVTDEFPDVGISYLNNASVSRLPLSSIRAMNNFLAEYNRVGPDSKTAANMIEDLALKVRRTMSSIIHAYPDEIIFTQSTTDGINAVSEGIKVGFDHNIVIRDIAYEHRANVFPWLRMQSRTNVRIISVDQNGLFTFEDLASKIDDDTALVALSHVLYNTGAILPLEYVKDLLADGTYFFVDGAQSVGSLGEYDFSKIECDFMAFNGSKWLCGPMGTGIFFCSREASANLDPSYVGGESAMIYNETKLAFKNIPDKFEAGYRNFVGLAGLASSLDIIKKIGFDAVQKHNKKMSNMLRDELAGMRDVVVYGPENNHIGVVPFTVKGRESQDVAQRLEKQGIVMAVREIGSLKVIRASPHFYNTESEIKAAADAIKYI